MGLTRSELQKPQQWRPSTALKKRRSNYLLHVDVAGVAAIFFFLVFMFLRLMGVPHEHRRPSVDMYQSRHASPQSAALKEDAIDIAVSRDGTVYLCNAKILPHDLPDQIREMVRTGSDPNIYIRADSRAKYGDVAAVLGRARLSGINHVVLITEQRDPGLRP